MSDDQKGMKLGLEDHFRYLSAQWEDDANPWGETPLAMSCARHVETNFTDNFLRQVTDQQLTGKMYNQFRWLRRFGDERLRVPIWDATMSLWSTTYNQPNMARNFETAHIKTNPYWMHAGPYGSAQNSTQAVEVRHNHNIKNPIREVLLEKKLKNTLPQPSSFCLEQVFFPRLRAFSIDMERKLLEGKGFAMKKVFTANELNYARQFSRLPDLIRIAPEFWAWRSYTGDIDDTAPCTKAEALKSISLINGLLEGTITRQLTDEELFLVCTFYFATPNDCICMEWMNKLGCIHNIFVRLIEGLNLDGLLFDFKVKASRTTGDFLVEHRQPTKKGASRSGRPFFRHNRGKLCLCCFVSACASRLCVF